MSGCPSRPLVIAPRGWLHSLHHAPASGPMTPESPLAGKPDTLGSRLRQWAQCTPDAPALLAPGRTPLPYDGLARQIDRVANALTAAGVPRGGRVAVVMPDGPDMASLALATAACTACAPLDPRFGSAALRRQLHAVGAAVVIAPAAGAPDVRDAAREAGIPCLEVRSQDAAPAGWVAFDGLGVPGTSMPRPEPDDVALVLHTSGTSGQPKRVLLTQRNLCASAAHIAASLHLTPADRSLCVMPLFHIHGLVASLLAALWAGGSVACASPFDARRMPEWLEELAPTWYSAVPAMHVALLGKLRTTARKPALHLRFVRSASAALGRRLAAELETTLGVPVIEAYGMTEAAHQIASNPLPPAPRRHGSVGFATGTEIVILGPDGRVLPAGSPGEIAIRGDNVIAGYETKPGDRTLDRSAFVDSWLRTGDEGCFDGDGYLVITGRLKEMINRGGEKVVPREVEEALLECPEVRQAAVFAVPHPTLGEDVAAAVVAYADAQVTVDGLRCFLADRLAAHAIPSRILMLAEIPVGATGKVQRHRLAELLRARLEAPYVEPHGATELGIAEIFAEVLGVQDVGACDDFFTLGGESLRGTQVLARLRARYGIALPLVALFRMATPAELAQLVDAAALAGDDGWELTALLDRLAPSAAEDVVRRVRDAAPPGVPA